MARRYQGPIVDVDIHHSWRNSGEILEFGGKVRMVEEEPLNGTVEDDYLEVFVRFNFGDDLAELQNKFRAHQIKRWVVKCGAPAGGRYPVKPYLRCLRVR